jgi:hypothetical protein
VSRSISRSILPAVLAVGAIGIAACGSSNSSSAYGNRGAAYSGSSSSSTTSGGGGGGGGALSVSAYESQGVAALKPVLAALTAVKTTPSDPNNWDQLSSAAKQASSTFSGLNAPSNISDLNSQIASSFSAEATAAGNASTAIKNHDQAAFQSAQAAFRTANASFESAITQLKGKGVRFLSSS